MTETLERPTPLIVQLPHMVKAKQVNGQRTVYFEASREGVQDREGEDIAADALWACRERFLAQNNLDVNHFSWLGNPYGSGARPEYVIGHASDVSRDGPSIYVKGEIFSNKTPPPPGSNGDWADWFWHSLTELDPPMRWYASVFGSVLESERVRKRGRMMTYITKVDWYSVGFAQRPQHPELEPVATSPLGPLTKASSFNAQQARASGALVMDYRTFAKAMTVGTPVTDSADKTGVQALTPTSLEGVSYKRAMPRVLGQIMKGELEPRREQIAKAFKGCGCTGPQCHNYTERLLIEAANKF